MFVVESYSAIRRIVLFGRAVAVGVYPDKASGEAEANPLLPVIDPILEADQSAPLKQRQTANRIFNQLRDELGFADIYMVVKIMCASALPADWRHSCR